MKTTNFFTQLQESLKGHDAMINLTQGEEGKLTVSFLPNKKNGKTDLIPLNMDGTAAEFDQEFLNEISKAIEVVERKGLVTNQEEFKKAAEVEEVKPENKKTPIKKEVVKPVKAKKTKPDEETKVEAAAEVKEDPQLEIEDNAKPVEPVKHTKEDLEEFRALLETKLSVAKDEFIFIKRMKEQGSNRFTPDEVNKMFDDQEKLIAAHEVALKQVTEETYGINPETGQLFSKVILLSNPLINQ